MQQQLLFLVRVAGDAVPAVVPLSFPDAGKAGLKRQERDRMTLADSFRLLQGCELAQMLRQGIGVHDKSFCLIADH